MSECLFCRIVQGDIPAAVVLDDDRVLVFSDIAPVAPTHMLAIPKEHFDTAADLAAADPTLLGEVLAAATRAAEQAGLAGGYRLVVNSGDDGGQTVGHLHVHVMGGRQLTWPPG